MSDIEHVHARQIFDSRGNPTIEVDVRLSSGAWAGRGAVGRVDGQPGGTRTTRRRDRVRREGGGPCHRECERRDRGGRQGPDASDQRGVDGH